MWGRVNLTPIELRWELRIGEGVGRRRRWSVMQAGCLRHAGDASPRSAAAKGKGKGKGSAFALLSHWVHLSSVMQFAH